jgi:hypothetical protein
MSFFRRFILNFNFDCARLSITYRQSYDKELFCLPFFIAFKSLVVDFIKNLRINHELFNIKK